MIVTVSCENIKKLRKYKKQVVPFDEKKYKKILTIQDLKMMFTSYQIRPNGTLTWLCQLIHKCQTIE